MEIETFSIPKLNHSGNEGGGACANKLRRILNSGRDSFVSIPGRARSGADEAGNYCRSRRRRHSNSRLTFPSVVAPLSPSFGVACDTS